MFAQPIVPSLRLQANPPDTGEDPAHRFTLTVAPPSPGGLSSGGASSLTWLQEGTWPFDTSQATCLQRAAGASDVFARFVYLSALTGTALLYGLGSPEVEALRTASGAEQLGNLPIRQARVAGANMQVLAMVLARLLAHPRAIKPASEAPDDAAWRLTPFVLVLLPLRQVVQEYLAWANSTMAGCGLPADFTAGPTPASPFELVAWWASVGEADIPGLAEGSPGRRLLALLDGLFGSNPAGKHLVAGAIGAGAGFIGGLLGSAAQKAIIVAATAAGTAVGGPIGATVGMVVGVAVGTLVSTAIGEASKMAGQALTEDLLGSEGTVLNTFALGNEV